MSKAAFALASLVLIAGCTSRPKPPMTPPPPTPDQVAQIRTAFMKVSPQAKIGVVSAVLTDSPYAMASDMPTDGLKAGDIVSFVDGTQATVAHGRIVRTMEGNKAAVEYMPGIRAPMVGDVVVKF
jgi:hypothetical protein